MPPQKAPPQTAPDPRAELERLRKLKRLRELQAKAAGQPLPSGPKPDITPFGGAGEFDPKAFAGINVVQSKPLPAPNAPNPIVTAQRESQQQVMTDWAGQQRDARQAAAAAEAQRKVDQREADAAFGGMDGLPMRVLDDGTVGPTPQRDLGVRGTVNVLNTPSETGNFLLELGEALAPKRTFDPKDPMAMRYKPAPPKAPEPGPAYDPRSTFGDRGLGGGPAPQRTPTPQPEAFRFPKLPLDAPQNDAEMVADVGGKFIGAVMMPGGVFGASEKVAAGIGKGLAPTLAKASPIVQQTAGYGGRLGLLGARGAYDAGRIGGIMGEDGSKVKTAYDWAADPLNWAIEPLGSIIYRATIFLKTGGKQVTPNRVQLEGAMNTLQRADASPDQLRAAVETINRITPPPSAAPEAAPTPPYPRPDLDAAQARPTVAPTPEQAASATPPYPRPDMDPVPPETVTAPPAPVESVGPPKRFSASPEPRGRGVMTRNADRIVGGAVGAWTGGAYDAVAAGADGSENRGFDIINPISGGVAGMLVPRFAGQAWRAGRRAVMPPTKRSAYDARIAYNVLRKQLERAGMRTPEEVVAAKEASFGGINASLLDITQEGVNTATNLSRLPGTTPGTMRNRAEELIENRPGRVERYIEETTGLSTAAVSGDVKKLADEAMENASPAYKALRESYPFGSINSQRLEQIEGLAPHIQAVDEYRLFVAANEGRVVGDFEYWDLVKRDIDAKEQQLIDKFGATMDDIRVQKLESARSALVAELDNLVKGYSAARELGGEAPKIREAFAEGQTYFGGRYSGDEVLEKISKWNGVPLTAAQSGVVRIILGKAKTGGAAVSALSSARAKEQLAAVFGKAKTDDLQAFLAADAAIVQNASRTNPNVGSATGQVMLGAGEGMIPAAAEAIRAARNPVEAVLGRMSQSGAYSQAQRDIMGEMLAKGVTAENLAPIFAGRRPRGGGRPRGGAGPTTPQGPPTAGGTGPAGRAAAGPPPRAAAAAATQQPRPAPSQEAVLAAMAQVTQPGPGRAREPMGPPARETIWDGPIPTKPQSLRAWIRSQGGIDDTNYMTGDVAAMMGGSNRMPGLINRRDGTGLDELTRKAYQEGFDVNPEDAGTLMRLIEEEFAGNPSYRIGAKDEWEAYQDTLRARRDEEPDQNSLGAFPGAGNAAAAASSVGGAAYGYYNPQDANEDGVIDDYDRQMTAMGMGFGGLVTAGLVRGAMGNRPKGPPGVQSNSFGGGKAESRPKGPPKQRDAMAKFKAEMIAAYPKAKGWNANKWRAKLREYRDMFVAGSDDGSFSAADLGREAPIAAAAKLAWDKAQRADRLPDSGVEIAARIPTSKRPFEDAGTYRLTPDMEAMRENPETFNHNMRLVRKYPGMPEVPGGKAADVAEAAVRHTTDNLKYIWRMIPEKVRERTRKWYVGANNRATRMAKDADKPVESMAAVIASLSPQKDWNQNVSLGERVVLALKTKGNHPWTPEMEARARKIYGNEAYAEDLEAIRGKTLGQLTDPYEKAMWIRVNDEAHSDRSYYIISPEGENVGERGGIAAWGSNSEIAKAVKVFENPSRANISEVIGKRNKVRSFYNNIVNPKSAVDITSDTHAVAAMWMRPLSGNSPEVAHNFGNSLAKAKQPKGWKAARSVAGNGSVGTYGLAHEAYTRAARELSEEFGQTILPREVQSVVWEAVRNLFPANWKTAANKAAIDEIWQRFSKGEITLEGARDAIVQKAGGFDAAKWDTPRSHSELDAEARDAADAGELLDEGVPGRRAKAVDGGTGRRSARGTAGLPSVRSAGSGGDGGGRYSSGGLAPLEGAPNVRGATGPDVGIVSVAESFAEKSGIPFRRQARYAEVDEALARRIAQAYEDMPHAPQDPAVRAAYENLSRQTRAQYDALVDAGYRFDFFDAATDPYKGNPSDAMRDLRANKRMSVYGTYDGYGTAGVTGADIANNPMLADTGVRWTDQNGVERPVLVNDLFRAVHDAFGHGLEGAGFRARGEENAWQAHMRLYTGDARAAATNETRGQNSWVNYGPLGDANRTASLEDTKFARQKTGLMPEWTWTENLVEDALPVERSSAAKGPANALKSGRAPVKGPPAKSGRRALPGQTSQSSPMIGSALASGGLTAGATYAATGDEDLALRAGLGAGIVGGVVGSRLSKGSTPKPPKGPPKSAPVKMGFGGSQQVEERGQMFYSALSRAVEKSPTTKAPAGQWKATIANSPGVKAEEIEWTGVNEWLDMQDGPVTKQQVSAYLKNNGVEIEETVKGAGRSSEAQAKYEAMQRELLPKIDRMNSLNNQLDKIHADLGLLEAVKPNAREQIAELSAKAKSTHAETKSLYGQINELRADMARIQRSGTAKWSSYTLPGGENYRELLLKMPPPETQYYSLLQKLAAKYDVDRSASLESWAPRLTPYERNSLERAKARYDQEGVGYKSSHWDEPNVLAHIRFNERTSADGKRILAISEFQSDWHQAGRKSGYRTPEKDAAIKRAEDALEQARLNLRKEDARTLKIVTGYDTLSGARSDANYDRNALARLRNNDEEWVRAYDENKRLEAKAREERTGFHVPDAPFKNNAWAALSLKRMIRWAAENGFDEIAWNAGQYPVERFSLGHALGDVTARQMPDGRVSFTPGNGSRGARQTLQTFGEAGRDGDTIMTREQAMAAFGEDAGSRMFDQTIGVDQPKIFAGDDLNVGGEKMRNFYDKTLINEANSIGKKYGARVYTREIDTPAGRDGQATVKAGPKTFHSLPITPELKKRALGGQSLFGFRGDATLAALGSVGGSFANQDDPQAGALDGMALALGGKYALRGASGKTGARNASGANEQGFGSGPRAQRKGPPKGPLMSPKAISELEAASKGLPRDVRSRLAENAARPLALRVSAAEAAGDDPSIYAMAAPFQRIRKPFAADYAGASSVERGINEGMARIDRQVGPPPPLDTAGETVRLSERQRRLAVGDATRKANSLNPYANEAAGIPDKPLPKGLANREKEATDLAIAAREMLARHRLTADEYEQAVASANQRKAAIADALITGRMAPPARPGATATGVMPGSAGQSLPPRNMPPVSRREADDMAALIFDREQAKLLDDVLSGNVTPRNRSAHHAALLYTAGGTLAVAGATTTFALVDDYNRRNRKPAPVEKPNYTDPGDPRFVWDWEKLKSTRNDQMQNIQIQLNALPPNASGVRFNLKPDGKWSRGGPTDQAIQKWLYDNGFDPNGPLTMEHAELLDQQVLEARRATRTDLDRVR